MLDRIDIHLDVAALKTDDLLNTPSGENSTTIRKRVIKTRAIQLDRFKNEKIFANSQMTHRHIKEHCALDKVTQKLLREAIDSLGLSARAHDKILRLARTIADLNGKEKIEANDLAEAISYRTLDRN